MATGNQAPATGQSSAGVVNDFSINIATVNGSGSQSANSVLLRCIFDMGVPVGGKNLFPSNISGMPTWFLIRASKDGYLARKAVSEILIAMNPETALADIAAMPPAGVVIHEENLKLAEGREDLIYYAVPFDKITAEVCPAPKLRKLVKNMVYVGVAAQLLGMELAIVEEALRWQFSNKQKVFELNYGAALAGFEFARQSLVKRDPYKIERMDKNAGKIIVDGNTSSAIGAVFAGVTVIAWYPITPSTSTIEAAGDLLKKLRKTPEGKATFAVVQSEDELAAIGTVFGAGWAGARSMTATSGPGMSLMAEFCGLAYFAEIPGVIVNVQRVGPSTGLPTRTQQADILAAATLSHGDTRFPLLLPGSAKECYELTRDAFDLAERAQMPVFVMSDLDLGMNNWLSDVFEYPTKPLDRGKVLTAEDLERLGGFARYRDVDGDGIGWRTLPGTRHPKAVYFTRGSGHGETSAYTEKPEEYKGIMDRLNRKFDQTVRQLVPPPEIVKNSGSKIGFIAFGSTDFAMRESLDLIQSRYGIEADYLRLKAYPFAASVREFVESHERVYVVEQNRDGQMASLLKLDLPARLAARFSSILHYNGWPVDAESITREFATKEGI